MGWRAYALRLWRQLPRSVPTGGCEMRVALILGFLSVANDKDNSVHRGYRISAWPNKRQRLPRVGMGISQLHLRHIQHIVNAAADRYSPDYTCDRSKC
jgi:hypothetical protein